MTRTWLAVVMTVAAIVSVQAQEQGISPVLPLTPEQAVFRLPEADVQMALAVGTKAHGGRRGLVLRDSGKGFLQAMTALSNGAGGVRNAMPSEGFWVEAWTPLSWVEQQASNAAKQFRTLTPVDVTADMQPVLRVRVHPDSPTEVSARGMYGASSVEHVVLRSLDHKLVAQPLTKEPFTEEVSNAMGGKAVFQGVAVTFSLDDLATVRGKSGEFFITVIGEGRGGKDFKVKKKHFDDLR
jgi:hypothetical protein